MTGIKVLVGQPVPSAALEPRYDTEADVLVAESPVVSEWPFGVDIDGALVFDLDAHYMLVNFDLHIGRQRWLQDLSDSWRVPAREGSLWFTAEAVAIKSFALPLRVRTDRSRAQVQVEIGAGAPSAEVALSARCVALLHHDELAGFRISLGADKRGSRAE
jgi:hypothetical protein